MRQNQKFKTNVEIRQSVKDNGLYLWQVADFLGICELFNI